MATSNTDLPFGINLPSGSMTLDLSDSADVNDATKKAGRSFGKLIETTGLAVAESQRQLNDVGAAATLALASKDAMVDVIAAQVNVYDDEGNLVAPGAVDPDTPASTGTLTQKLPLINFIDPVFYEWAQVRLQGMFFAQEFVASTETSSFGVSASSQAQNTGTSIIFGVGSNKSSLSLGGSGSDVDTENAQSFGHIRASALLQPKTDIGVPKPRQLVDAPSLSVRVSADVDDDSEPGTRLKQISVLWFKRDGSKQVAGKRAPSIEVTGALWEFGAPAAGAVQGETDGEGEVPLLLKRVLPVPAGATEPDRTPVDVTVVVRLGVVSSTSVLRF
ncbi:MAG: hypothetical protein V4795_02155 [Pseudomonadota bacterium]